MCLQLWISWCEENQRCTFYRLKSTDFSLTSWHPAHLHLLTWREQHQWKHMNLLENVSLTVPGSAETLKIPKKSKYRLGVLMKKTQGGRRNPEMTILVEVSCISCIMSGPVSVLNLLKCHFIVTLTCQTSVTWTGSLNSSRLHILHLLLSPESEALSSCSLHRNKKGCKLMMF